MDEETVFAIVGRLYVGLISRDNEIKRLNSLLQQSPRAQQVVLSPAEGDPLMETADMGTD